MPRAHTRRRARTVTEPSLAQCVLLSMLLHIWLVLLFGTAERGGGWRAQDLDATLAPYLSDSSSRVRVLPGAQPGERDAPPVSRPGAATRPSRAPARPDVAPATTAEPAAEIPEPPSSSPPPEVPSVESLPSLDRGAPEVVDKAIEPRREEPLPRELLQETIPRVDLQPPRMMEPALAPAPPPPIPQQTPLATPRPAAPRARPAAEPEKAPVVETPTPVPPLAAPSKIERETPEVEPEPKLAPLSPVTPPVIAPPEQQLPRFAPETPRPLIPETPVPALEAPPVIAPPATAPPAPPRAERPMTSPQEEAPTVRPTPSTPTAAPAAPEVVSPEPSPRIDTERPSARDVQPARPAITPQREPPTAEPVPRLKFGAPEDPDDIFKPRTSPPVGVVPPPGQAPRLNLEAAKKEQAGPEIGRSSGRKGIFNLDSPPPEPVSKLGKAIQKAGQPDCRDAYAGMGLLAVPFLAFDTITDTGCRW